MEFFDSVGEFPEYREAVEVVMIDVNRKQLVVCARQDHVEEWGSCTFEVNGGP